MASIPCEKLPKQAERKCGVFWTPGVQKWVKNPVFLTQISVDGAARYLEDLILDTYNFLEIYYKSDPVFK